MTAEDSSSPTETLSKLLAGAAPLSSLHYYWRNVFQEMQREDEFINSEHADWSGWVAFVEAQFSFSKVSDKSFIALSLCLNKIELPKEYQETLHDALHRYLSSGLDMERAFFGYRQKLPFNKRFARFRQYRLYFQEMILAQKIFIEGNARSRLQALILDSDLDNFDSIYRAFGDWKKSDDCKLFVRYWKGRQKEIAQNK